jgi:hypothetical protein
LNTQDSADNADSARAQFVAKQAITPGVIVYWKFKAPMNRTLYALKSIPADDYEDWAVAFEVESTATLMEMVDGYSWAQADAIVDAVVDSYTADGLRADYAGRGWQTMACLPIAGRIKIAIKAVQL